MPIIKTNNFEIKSLGIQEKEVYDIEVEKTHNFFANDILVHNSCYVTLDKLVADKNLTDDQALELLNKASLKNIEPLIAKIMDEINQKYVNGIPGALSMKREAISKKAIWTGKKRYILWVLDMEGIKQNPPKLKAMGVEIKKAVIPKFCKERMTETIKLLMQTDNNDDIIKNIELAKTEFFNKSPDEISMPKSMNNIEKWSDKNGNPIKGTPMHVKGAMVFNRLIDEFKLHKKYEKIKSGDKIRILNLREPNIAKAKLIAFHSELPKEFGLNKYINYEIQFNKSFLDPLNIILKAVKWTSEKKSSLKKFF